MESLTTIFLHRPKHETSGDLTFAQEPSAAPEMCPVYNTPMLRSTKTKRHTYVCLFYIIHYD